MRKEPWHQRLPAAEHYAWFNNLVELHELTGLWLKEIRTDHSEHAMARGFTKQVADHLWILNSLTERKLEDFLDDTTPEDVLARLEHSVWATQAWTLKNVQLQASHSSHASHTSHLSHTSGEALNTVLEQISWKAGRKSAQKRWAQILPKENETGRDLRDVILAFQDSPALRTSRRDAFLLRRAVSQQVEVELLSCPHRLPYHEVHDSADRLCELHWHFLKGFAYALNSKISSEAKHLRPRCVHVWYLNSNSTSPIETQN